MKKTKISLTLMTALLSVGTLAGCDEYFATYSPKGTLISYTINGGEGGSITADDIFAEYYNDSDKYQSIFDAIKSIIVRNYFTVQTVTGSNGEKGIEKVSLPDGTEKVLGYAQVPDLEVEADTKVDSDVYQAKLNAQNNNSNYEDEFEQILKSRGVETKEELKEKYLDELKTQKFDENYYKYYLDEIKNGYKVAENETDEEKKALAQFWTGYFDNMLPYHVSHILVKVTDSGASNYYNGTLSEENCETLYLLMDELTSGNKTFGKIANTYSEDSGSKAKYGDLGIMDYSTSFVNEFKLGVYAYENLYGEFKEEVEGTNIQIPDGIDTSYNEVVSKAYGEDFPSVDVDVFTDLYNSRKQTKSTEDDSVMQGSTLVYPRNVIYNQVLNRHSFAFIENKTASAQDDFNVLDSGELVEGETGFYTFTSSDSVDSSMYGREILCTVVAGQIRPILMVRAGTSDYQGIHFIVVNRDAFLKDEDANGVNRDDYYTTYRTNQDGYPKNSNGTLKQTYVNFNSEFGGTDSNTRADSFVSTLKNYDSDKLSKFIFKKYMMLENVEILDKNIEYALNKWIDNSVETKERDNNKTRTNTWTDYVGTLRKQNEERTKLMSSLARIGFDFNVKDEIADHINDIKEYATKGDLYWNKVLVTSTNVDAWYNEVIGTKYETLEDLYNKKGAPCNDGKEYK